MSTEQTNPRDVIAQALALSAAATEGPWIVERATEHSAVQVMTQATDPETGERRFVATTGDPHYDGTVEDAELAAAARTLLPALAKALGDVLDLADSYDDSPRCSEMADSLRTAITAALSEVTEDCAPDCDERTNCPRIGGLGHMQCGTCPEHQQPRHHCGCLATTEVTP